ncbi:MAG TPA: NADH-dependent alcohol dehydrogenase [Clostridiales bacterium]|nr:NADH-dependent alcohol dehydrogenase [Clostridiales bacterium]
MESFVFEYPTKVYFGQGAAKQYLCKELEQYGNTVLLAYGGGSIKRNGVYEEIFNILREAGKTVVEFSGIMPNPTYAKVQEGAELARNHGVDLILAVGGGSVIDCCKIAALQAKTNEDVWEAELIEKRFPKCSPIPLGAVVTVSGTGSEMNAGGVITNEEKKMKTGLFAIAPRFAVLDPTYTMSVPFPQVMSGAFDTLSHAMETYFGYPNGDNVSDDINEAVMKSVIRNMRILLKDPNNATARSNLMWDSAMAENGLLKLGKKTDFQAHMIEHQLGAYTDCNHGMGLAVIHPVYYRHIVKEGLPKFVCFAENVWEIPKGSKAEIQLALAGIDALAAFIAECGLPSRLSELKVKTPITDRILEEAAYSTAIQPNSYKKLTYGEIYEILKECM